MCGLNIKDIQPDPDNPRKIADPALDGLDNSLNEFGDLSGIVWNKTTGELVSGHQRFYVLRRRYGDALQMEDGTITTPDGERFPVRVVELDRTRQKAANLTANNPHIGGDFTPAALDAIGELRDELPELVTGLRLDDLAAALEDEFGKDAEVVDGNTDPDDVPDAPEEAVTKPGDLWRLGEHRLLCGDSTKAEDVDRVMGGDSPRTLISSPPYYNARDYAHWETVDDYIADMVRVVGNAALMSADFCVIWNIGDQPVNRLDLSSLSSCAIHGVGGLEFRDKMAWVKPGAVFDIPRNGHILKGKYYPAFSWEPLLVFTKGEHPTVDPEFRRELNEHCTDTWSVETVSSQNEEKGHHSAAFPVGLPMKCLKCYSASGDIIYEPFSGSGTTIIACEQLSRRCRAIEIDPIYCDVAIRRWEEFTGEKAERIV